MLIEDLIQYQRIRDGNEAGGNYNTHTPPRTKLEVQHKYRTINLNNHCRLTEEESRSVKTKDL